MTENNYLLQPLPEEVLKSVYKTNNESEKFVKTLLEKTIPEIDKKSLEDDLHKSFLLLKHKANKKQPNEIKVRRRKTYITRHEKNKLGIGKLNRKAFTYSSLLPLHNLWQEYMQDFLELDKYKNKYPTVEDKNWDNFSSLLTKADFHGAKFTVVRSKCPNVIGHSGICVMETKNMLHLVDESNITRQIPKQSSVFQVEISGLKLIIFGKHLNIRPSERSTKKIKNRVIGDL